MKTTPKDFRHKDNEKVKSETKKNEVFGRRYAKPQPVKRLSEKKGSPHYVNRTPRTTFAKNVYINRNISRELSTVVVYIASWP